MNSECHSIVIEYLMHNCFQGTAKALLKETAKLELCASSCNAKTAVSNNNNKEDERQWVLLDARKSLVNAIEQGDIDLAFDLIKKYFPVLAAQDLVPNGILPPNNPEAVELQDVLFQLRCQRFIEIIRSSQDTISAIRYAQTHLKPTTSRAKEQVKEVTALIAYADPHASKSSHLLRQERREQLANKVNCILLAQCNLPVQTSIEKISRQYAVVEEELEKNNVASPHDSHREKIAI